MIQGKSEMKKWDYNKNSKELSSFLNNCINIEKLLLSINDKEQNLKRCKNEITSVIKFSPSEGDELNEFISKLTSFGQIYKEVDHIQTITLEGSKIELKIKSIKEKPNGLSIKIFFFNEEYKNYYPNDAIFEEDKIFFTLHLDAKKEFINKVFENKVIYENLLKEMMKLRSIDDLSIRRSDDKLILDMKEKDQNDKILYYFFKFFNDFQILINFQNNFTFEKLKEMNFDEFSKLFLSFGLLLNA